MLTLSSCSQVGTCFGIRAGVYLGNALNATKVALDRAAEAWPDVPPSAVAQIEHDWSKVDEARNQTNECVFSLLGTARQAMAADPRALAEPRSSS